MNDANLGVAKKMIERLSSTPDSIVGSASEAGEPNPLQRIIEAARASYVLPSFCAELNQDAMKCIECIIEHKPPAICREKLDEDVSADFDIDWSDE